MSLSEEARNLLELKGMKSSFRGIVKSAWDELEETVEKFIKEGRR